jgi:hypothetical protein
MVPSPLTGVALPPGPGRKAGSLNRKTMLKLATMREEFRPHVAAAIETLVRLATDPDTPPAVQRGAATDILDRFYGKPKESVKIEGDSTGILNQIQIIFSDKPNEIKTIDG